MVAPDATNGRSNTRRSSAAAGPSAGGLAGTNACEGIGTDGSGGFCRGPRPCGTAAGTNGGRIVGTGGPSAVGTDDGTNDGAAGGTDAGASA